MLIRVMSAVLAVTAITTAQAWGGTLTVAQDRAQCPHAPFASIQAAVDNARPGDTVKVCAGTYAEQVTVTTPLTLTGEDATVDPPDGTFAIAFRLAADDITLRGFTIQGASVGVDTNDRFSGYRVDHNTIRDNALFAIDAGSSGALTSRFDHNTLSANDYGLVSELTDDTLWPDPPVGTDRHAYARDLRNARVDHNDTTLNGSGVETAGPGQPLDVSFDHNRSVQDRIGISIQNSIAASIRDNEILEANLAIVVGGANRELEIANNYGRAINGGAMAFQPALFVDVFSAPSRDVEIKNNDVSSSTGSGINFAPNTLQDSLITGNTSSASAASGINLGAGNTGNAFRANEIDNNLRTGIMVRAGATGNTFARNSMDGNGTLDPLSFFDARDDNTPLNTWVGNDCATDFPAGALCGG
jgi:nitrous oxidase accessory protein NosD